MNKKQWGVLFTLLFIVGYVLTGASVLSASDGGEGRVVRVSIVGKSPSKAESVLEGALKLPLRYGEIRSVGTKFGSAGYWVSCERAPQEYGPDCYVVCWFLAADEPVREVVKIDSDDFILQKDIAASSGKSYTVTLESL